MDDSGELGLLLLLEYLFKENIAFCGVGITCSLNLELLQACSIHWSIHLFWIRLFQCKYLLKVEYFEYGTGGLPALFTHKLTYITTGL